MEKKQKKIIAVVLLAVVLCLNMVSVLYARGRVQVDRLCSFSIQTSSGTEDLNTIGISVKLYRVAQITEDGNFIPEEPFTSVKVNEANAETTAADWEAYAKAAADIVEKDATEPTSVCRIENGKSTEQSLPAGLYLLCADAVKSTRNSYTFTPYLVTLPGCGEADDDWQYEDLHIALKCEWEPLYGSLSVTKRLDTCNQSLGKPMFVFDVEAVLDGETVYSNVLSLSFSEAGEKSVTVDKLPAGAQVTVTEVYSGASYVLTSDESVDVEIVADEKTDAFFSNTYDEKLTYGTGVVNHFEYDGNGYSWEQKESNE